MPVAVTSRLVSGVVIVDVTGRLCFLEVALRDQVNELLDEGHRDFVLNLAGVPYIDSFGLGQLVSIWTSIRSEGGQLVLLRPTDHAQQLLSTHQAQHRLSHLRGRGSGSENRTNEFHRFRVNNFGRARPEGRGRRRGDVGAR